MASSASYRTGVSDWTDLGAGPMIVQTLGEDVFLAVSDAKPDPAESGVESTLGGQPLQITATGHVWARSRLYPSRVVASSTGGALAQQTTPAPTVAVSLADPGNLKPGVTLTAAAGVRTGSPAITYQWFRSNVLSERLDPIPLATALSYVVQDADLGRLLVLAETATLAPYFSRTIYSQPVSIPLAASFASAAPVLLRAPAISGTANQGQTLTVVPGGYGGADSVAGQWRRDGAPVAGATGLTYLLQAADVGSRISYGETASRGAFTTSVTSRSTARIDGLPSSPQSSTPVKIVGTAQVGQTLTLLAGTWTGNPKPTISEQWYADGVAVAGATGGTLTVDASLQGKTITVVETATNSQGAASVTSSAAGPVAPRPAVAPGVPAAPVPGALTYSTAALSWAAPGSGDAPTGYTLRYRTQGASGWATATVGSAATSGTLTGLQASTAYEVQLSAYNAAGASDFSGSGTFATSAAPVTGPAAGAMDFSTPDNSGLIAFL